MAYETFRIDSPKGVNFTREPVQIDPAIWDEADNAAFRHGITKKVSGYEAGFGELNIRVDGIGGDNDFFKTGLRAESIVSLRDDTQEYMWWAYAGQEEGSDGLPKGYIARILSKDVHLDATNRVPDGTAKYDSTIPYYTERQWTGDSVNGVPYMTMAKPYMWGSDFESGQSDKFTDLPLWPSHIRCDTVRTYRNYMIALNIESDSFTIDENGDPVWTPGGLEDPSAVWCPDLYNEGETAPSEWPYPTREEYAALCSDWGVGKHQNAIWWSDEVIGKNPELSSWADADPTSTSGWNFLGGSGGPIVDGKALKDSFIIYRERSAWQMTYIGGINVFAFKELYNDVGCLGVDCIAEIDGWHFVVGQSDVYMHNGVQKRSVADGVVRKEIFNSIDPTNINKVFVAVRYEDKEAWVCIPEASTSRHGLCNVAWVYNWEEQSWSKRTMPNSECAVYTILSIPQGDFTWESADEGGPLDGSDNATNPDKVGCTWEEASDKWLDSMFYYNPSQWGLAFSGNYVTDTEIEKGYIFTSTKDSKIIDVINDSTGAVINFETSIEKKWMDMQDYGVFKTANKIYPLVRNGTVDVYMSGTKDIQDHPIWKFVGTFDPNERAFLGSRVTGRYLHVKFVIPDKSRAEIRGYKIEFNRSGSR